MRAINLALEGHCAEVLSARRSSDGKQGEQEDMRRLQRVREERGIREGVAEGAGVRRMP